MHRASLLRAITIFGALSTRCIAGPNSDQSDLPAASLGDAAPRSSAPAAPVVVDLTSPAAPPATQLAVQVCAGLANRRATGSAFVLLPGHDEDRAWLALLRPDVPSPPPTISADAFLASCLAQGGATRGRLRYGFSQQQLLVGNIITLAAALALVPLEDSSPFANTTVVGFDALSEWRNFSSLNATAFVFDRYASGTSALAIMNPGLDVHGHPLDPSPPLTGLPDLSLADYCVSASLFTFWLTNGCIPGTDENALLERMAKSGTWPSPIEVYGYNDAWPVAGDIFEAETGCVAGHNLGQIATVGVSNLAFFSGAPAVSQPLEQAPQAPEAFNTSRTYVTFVVGDGDNVAMVKTSRFDWFRTRLANCSGALAGTCVPLAWTLSPHLLTLAPDMLRWWFSEAQTTGTDFFVLPPSGHLYAYPSAMSDADQATFVRETESDARLMNASASVAWEFVGSWPSAISNYFPRYAERGVVRALFASNVPYMMPVVEFAENEFFKVLGNTSTPAVLFRPSEWRGTDGSALLPPLTLSVAAMASLLNTYPLGTVTHIYMTSDGGAQLSDFVALAALLDEHVRVVGPEALALVALQKARGAGT